MKIKQSSKDIEDDTESTFEYFDDNGNKTFQYDWNYKSFEFIIQKEKQKKKRDSSKVLKWYFIKILA